MVPKRAVIAGPFRRLQSRIRKEPLSPVYALLAVVAAALSFPIWAGGDTFAATSHTTVALPSFDYLADSVSAARFPEWWDSLGLGVPFAINPDHLALYPPAWVAALLPSPWSADFLSALHLVLLGAGCAKLASRLSAKPDGALLAGLAAMMGGAATASMAVGMHTCAVAWLPWIAATALTVADDSGGGQRGRGVAVLAALIAAPALAGGTSVAIVGIVIAICLGTARSARASLTLVPIAALVGAVVAAVAIGPGLAALAETVDTRPAGVLLDPFGFIVAAGGPATLAVGLPLVLLALVSLRRPKSAAAVAALLAFPLALAAGSDTAVGILAAVCPFETAAEVSLSLAIGGAVLLAAAAGVSLSSLREDELAGARAVRLLAVGGVLAGACAAAAWYRAVPALSIWTALGCTAITAAGVAIASRAERRSLGLSIAAAACVGILAPHSVIGADRIERHAIAAAPALVAPISARRGGDPARLYRPRTLLTDRDIDSAPLRVIATATANTATLWDVGYPRGADRLMSAELESVWLRAAATGERLLDLVGVDYAIVPSAIPMRRGLEPLGRYGKDLALIENDRRRPAAFVATRWRRTDRDSLLEELFPQGNARRPIRLATVHFIGDGESRLAPTGAGPTPMRPCDVYRPRPERAVVRCNSDEQGYAVLLDRAAPGWTATVDGDAAPIETADLLLRAVAIPAGAHEVEFRYRSPHLRSFALISLLAVLNLLLWPMVWRRRQLAPRSER